MTRPRGIPSGITILREDKDWGLRTSEGQKRTKSFLYEQPKLYPLATKVEEHKNHVFFSLLGVWLWLSLTHKSHEGCELGLPSLSMETLWSLEMQKIVEQNFLRLAIFEVETTLSVKESSLPRDHFPLPC